MSSCKRSDCLVRVENPAGSVCLFGAPDVPLPVAVPTAADARRKCPLVVQMPSLAWVAK